MLDVNLGLNYVSNIESIYLKLLNLFLNNYQKYYNNIRNLYNNDNFKIDMHSLKGISLNMGCKYLNELLNELEKKHSKEIINKLSNEFDIVYEEISNYLNNSGKI